jgi:hypothetical protein
MPAGASCRVSPVFGPAFAAAGHAGLAGIIKCKLWKIQYRLT